MEIKIEGEWEVSDAFIPTSNRNPFCGLTAVGYYYALRTTRNFALQLWDTDCYIYGLFTYLEITRLQTKIARQASHSILYSGALNFKFLTRVF